MRFIFYSVDSHKRLHHHIVDNVIGVTLKPAKPNTTDLYAFTASGQTYVFEEMNIETANKYIEKMKATDCMDLTQPIDYWMYLASEPAA